MGQITLLPTSPPTNFPFLGISVQLAPSLVLGPEGFCLLESSVAGADPRLVTQAVRNCSRPPDSRTVGTLANVHVADTLAKMCPLVAESVPKKVPQPGILPSPDV